MNTQTLAPLMTAFARQPSRDSTPDRRSGRFASHAAAAAAFVAAFGGIFPSFVDSTASAQEPDLYLRWVGQVRPQNPGPTGGFQLERWLVTTKGGGSIVTFFNQDDRQQHLGQALVQIASSLQNRLGPGWRVALEGPVATSPRDAGVSITGPDDEDSRRTSALVAAATAIVDQSRAASSDDASAIADADAATRRLEDAIRALRIETKLIPVTSSDAKQVAPALKLALPWATFTADPQTNSIIAAGTAQELAAAAELVASIDRAATQKRTAEEAARAKRIESTPYGRFTGRPLTIEFEGGTLGEFLSKLASKSGFRSWIVDEPQAEDAPIPPIRLVSVSADSALRALDGMPVQLTRFGQTIQTVLTVQRIDPGLSEDGSMLPIYRIGMPLPAPPIQKPPGTPARPDVRTEVFLVMAVGEDDSPAAIEADNAPLLAAIEAGTSLREGESTLRLRLHPPSRMLFASGSADELALVREIIKTWQLQF